MYTYIYTRPHKLLSFNSYHVKIKVTYLLTPRTMYSVSFTMVLVIKVSVQLLIKILITSKEKLTIDTQTDLLQKEKSFVWL